MDIVSRVLLRYVQEKRKADYDYVYDPDHKNRPHGGGQWYKTEKGWSNVEHETPSQGKKERSPNDWMESVKNLNSTGKERAYDYATRSQSLTKNMNPRNYPAIYDMIKTSPRIRRNIIDQLEKEPLEVEKTFGHQTDVDDFDEETVGGFKNSPALELGGMLANYYGKRGTDFGYFENDEWEDNRLSKEEQASLSDEDRKDYYRLNRVMVKMNNVRNEDDFDLDEYRSERYSRV